MSIVGILSFEARYCFECNSVWHTRIATTLPCALCKATKKAHRDDCGHIHSDTVIRIIIMSWCPWGLKRCLPQCHRKRCVLVFDSHTSIEQKIKPSSHFVAISTDEPRERAWKIVNGDAIACCVCDIFGIAAFSTAITLHFLSERLICCFHCK